MQFKPNYPELLADLALQLRDFLTERGLDAAEAEDAAREAAEHVRQHWGGQVVYIPLGLSAAVMRRWEEIWTKFRGDNVPQLAREYKCSEVHINRILRKLREVKRRDVQREMFPASEKPQA